jgi:hypothetical protein
MRPASILVGYHGCDRSVGESVLFRGKKLKASENDYDWLGHGIYFWENDPQRALDWAVQSQRRGKIKEPFVLGAVLCPSRCLDLTDQASLRYIKAAYDSLDELSFEFEVELPENKPAKKSDGDMLFRELDCMVINHLHYMRKLNKERAFDTVRGPFWEGGDLYPGARIKDKSHIQIAVRKPEVISGYFLPSFSSTPATLPAAKKK